jgi:tetratricopeptide (TPR) repeat protein
LEQLHRENDVERIATARLSDFPDDDIAIRALQHLASIRNQPEKADSYSKQLVALGKATSADLNNMAWNALIRGAVTPEFIEHAQRSLQLAQNRGPAPMHTLASLYAEIGQTAQARDLLIQSIGLRGNEGPESDDWYVLGRIAEQFGVLDTAAEAYAKVEKPTDERAIPDSAYLLAQRRLAAMGAAAR